MTGRNEQPDKEHFFISLTVQAKHISLYCIRDVIENLDVFRGRCLLKR